MRIIGFILGVVASCWHWWAGPLVYGIFCAIDESISSPRIETPPEGWTYREEYSQPVMPNTETNKVFMAYSRLGISPECSDEEVKRAYRKMAMQVHPDKYEGRDEQSRQHAKQEFIEINEAYELIKALRNIM